MTNTAWSALADRWAITWMPDAPHLDGSPIIVAAIREQLDNAHSSGIPVTPTGPWVRAVESEPFAVLAALGMLGLEHMTVGAPELDRVPSGTVA